MHITRVIPRSEDLCLNQRRSLAVLGMFAAAMLFATALYAHGGHDHNLLGTVAKIEQDHLVLTKKDGNEVMLFITKDTRFTRAGKEVTRDALAAGQRISVYLANDSKTAVTIKISPK